MTASQKCQRRREEFSCTHVPPFQLSDIQTTSYENQTRPAGSSLKPTIPDKNEGFLPKWSSDEAQGLGLIIHHKITPKKTNGSGEIRNQRTRLKTLHDDPSGHYHVQFHRPYEDVSRPTMSIHSKSDHFMKIYRARIEEERSEIIIVHEDPFPPYHEQGYGTAGQTTRPFQLGFNIHPKYGYFKRNERATSVPHRGILRDGHESILGHVHWRAKPQFGELTRPFDLGFIIHHQINYLEHIDRAKIPLVRICLVLAHLALPEGHVLPKMELSLFGFFEDYVWRPGELIYHLETVQDATPCTSIQRIRRILLHLYFPILEAFTLGALNLQRLFLYQSCCILKALKPFQRVPRCCTYLPKLSRYKLEDIPYLADFLIKSQTALCFKFCDSFLVLAY
ncbi:uncharacterized protein LOC111832058 [Capsella rubella]|uniref:uncharacterized protein LOC111832058 n=1 Tax=Capsella rubella TaxID=81985 RepID=UPI000CD58E66|nr:uncharacterized protein LOC111832058 [Capsella rubella]